MLNHDLQSRRLKFGFTQKQLAEKSGIGERTYQSLEAGGIPRYDTAQRIAKTLKTTPEKLFNRKDDKTNDTD